MDGTGRFNLEQTLQGAWQAVQSVTGHVLFDAALHGLAIALLMALVAIVLLARKQKYGRPLIQVAKKLVFICALMILPGFLFLMIKHQLPSTGSFHVNSLGFIFFWSWISLHLSAEEINFECN